MRPADGKYRLLFGNGGIHCLDVDGRPLWHHPLGEAQHVVAGRFRNDSELQFAVVDRTPVPTHRRDSSAWAILYLFNSRSACIYTNARPAAVPTLYNETLYPGM